MNIFLKIILAVLGFWIFAVAIIWSMRDVAIYPFDDTPFAQKQFDDWETWVLRGGSSSIEHLVFWSVNEGDTIVWRYNQESEKQVVTFVGNVGSIMDGIVATKPYVREGYGVSIMVYPGAQGAPGSPDQSDMIERGSRMVRALEDDLGVRPGIHGISMGGGLSVFITEDYTPKFLVLEAPLGNMWDIAKGRFFFLPPGLPDIDMWNSLEVASEKSYPVLVIHGDKDSLIPQEQGRMLAEKLGGEFVSLTGAGHNNMAQFGVFNHVESFIKERLTSGTIIF